MKMSDIAIDPEKLEHGAWVGDIPELGDIELRVRGMGCAEFRKLQSKLIEAIPRKRRLKGKLRQEDNDDVMDACLHRVILLDWRGIEGENGTPQPYDRDLALRWIKEPRFRKFREGIIWAAATVAEDIGEATDAALGNSQTPSAGISNGAPENPS